MIAYKQTTGTGLHYFIYRSGKPVLHILVAAGPKHIHINSLGWVPNPEKERFEEADVEEAKRAVRIAVSTLSLDDFEIGGK